jgi:hypothetical protein
LKSIETVSKAGDETENTSQPIPRHLTYQKGKDNRKQPIATDAVFRYVSRDAVHI